MGFLDTLLGRSKPAKPDLDALFAVPDAALTLESGAGFAPTGVGSVCFSAPEGGAFADLEREVQELLAADGGPAQRVRDSFGYTWLVCDHAAAGATRVSDLVAELHAVNVSLQEHGFGPSLLASVVGFRSADGRPLGLVYLYKRGTFYPFAPLPGAEQRRDNPLELQVRSLLADDLRVEPELSRWFPVWGAPGL